MPPNASRGMAASRTSLQCDDILFEIFQNLHPPNVQYGTPGSSKIEARKTLARCARVCKAFLPYALDHLWWEIDSISVALKVLPVLCVTSAKEVLIENTGEWVYIELPSPSVLVRRPIAQAQLPMDNILPHELIRYRLYAARVHKLHVSSEVWDDVLPRIKHVTRLLGGPLFPSIEELEYSSLDPIIHLTTIFPYIAATGSSLSCLSVRTSRVTRFFWEAMQDLDVLQPIIPACSGIHQLSLNGHWHSSSAASFIGAFIHLKTIQFVGSVDSALMRTFATLPDLAELHIRVERVETEARTSKFRSLRKFQLEGTHFATLNRFVELCECPDVQSFRVRIITEPISFVPWILFPWAFLPLLLTTIASKVSRSLRSLDVEAALPVGTTMVTLASILSPLRAIRTLQSIKLNTTPPFTTNYNWVVGPLHEIALGWPGLKEFQVHGGTLPNALQVIFDLVSVCPRLRIIILPKVILSPPSELNTYGLSRHSLRVIYVGYSFAKSRKEARQVASLLNPVFPDLDVSGCEELERAGKEALSTRRMTVWEHVLEEMGRLRRKRVLVNHETVVFRLRRR
ncbi:uncharacterized protein FIBRA_02651 [Fibroporia radiculosa]|uniref:F-box domain-containing protein n=1 Tax=Fibroporia radiculosa TaxID=599839 RepID=J4GN10_9APHY|nr:uncharacterized protein FIBRA_02651 [Fibroporia radiculosa]CCM00615.1 predicted protein [Fibroporia radiculosa]